MPTVKLAQAMGYRVLVTDMHRERPAHAIADLHEVVDITDLEATLAAAVPDVAAIVFNVAPGDAVGTIDDKDQRPGYILALSDASLTAIAACEQARGLMQVCMRGVNQPMALS